MEKIIKLLGFLAKPLVCVAVVYSSLHFLLMLVQNEVVFIPLVFAIAWFLWFASIFIILVLKGASWRNIAILCVGWFITLITMLAVQSFGEIVLWIVFTICTGILFFILIRNKKTIQVQ